jgi:hypothetical protein
MGPIMCMPVNDNDGSGAKETTTECMASPTPCPEKAPSAAEALQGIANLVKGQAGAITLALVEAAKGGQLAHARYLFELSGIYPKAAENKAGGNEESSTYRLLKEFGLPTEPGLDREAHATNTDDSKSAERTTGGGGNEDGRLAN